MFAQAGMTKLALAQFYESIADWILPHVRGRPLTLLRCATGADDDCSFMKHSKVWAPPALRRVRIREKTKLGEYLVIEDLAGIVGLVQMDVLEIHTWNSRADDVERPDRIVIDLDPGPKVAFARVIEGARMLRDILRVLGLQAFVKTTGGVGLHVVVPLVVEHDWSVCFSFARGLCEAIVRQHPRGYSIAMPKQGREDKILLDYLRNNRTNTSVAAFSTRARSDAPVSVPIAWDELGPRLRPDQYNLRNLPRRLRSLRADPWRDYFRMQQRLLPRVVQAVAQL
jgi:bifunctional non-homologous end joining protein LigD